MLFLEQTDELPDRLAANRPQAQEVSQVSGEQLVEGAGRRHMPVFEQLAGLVLRCPVSRTDGTTVKLLGLATRHLRSTRFLGYLSGKVDRGS